MAGDLSKRKKTQVIMLTDRQMEAIISRVVKGLTFGIHEDILPSDQATSKETTRSSHSSGHKKISNKKEEEQSSLSASFMKNQTPKEEEELRASSESKLLDFKVDINQEIQATRPSSVAVLEEVTNNEQKLVFLCKENRQFDKLNQREEMQQMVIMHSGHKEEMQHENMFEVANFVLSSREHQKRTKYVDFVVGDAASWNSKSKKRTELLEVLQPLEERRFQNFSPFNGIKFLEVECEGVRRNDPLFDKVKYVRGVIELKQHHKLQWPFDGGKGRMTLFSIQRLFPFEVGEKSDLRTNPFQGRGNDAILMSTKHNKEVIISVAGLKLHQIVHSSQIEANSDMSSFKQAYLSNQKELIHEPIFYRKITQQKFFWNWNQVHICSESRTVYFTIQRLSFRTDRAYGPEIKLYSSTQQSDRPKTTWRMLMGLSWFQQDQEQKKWSSDPQVISYLPKQVCLIYFGEMSMFVSVESLQNYLWRPGDILNHLEVSKTVFTTSSNKEIVRIRPVARVEAKEDQWCIIGLKQEFLDKESFRNLMGMFVIKSSLFLASIKSKKSPKSSLNFPAMKSDENEEEN